MNLDEYLQGMKQAIDESVKEDEKIQEFLVWLHEKTAPLASPYQESAVRAFYLNIVDGIHTGEETVWRAISRILDERIDKDINKVRGMSGELLELGYGGVFHPESTNRRLRVETNLGRLPFLINQINTLTAVDIVVDRNLSLTCDGRGGFLYLRIAVALLIRDSDQQFKKIMMSYVDEFPVHEKSSEYHRSKLERYLSKYRNLKLDWRFSDKQKQLLNKYYSANKRLIDCLQESNPSPEGRKEIQDTLFLPTVEIERRRLNVDKQLTMNESSESNSNLEVQETQEILLPIVEVQNHEVDATDTKLIGSTQESSSPVTQEVQEAVLPIVVAEKSNDKKEESYSTSTKTNFYRTIFLYSLLALALSIACAILLKKYA